ncbi:MAG TPA: hypothetical protein VN903_06950 [Polyangia bacterium]|jgi:hypothetical protein|nr:hypothetical protein [Polyangia bacterium]
MRALTAPCLAGWLVLVMAGGCNSSLGSVADSGPRGGTGGSGGTSSNGGGGASSNGGGGGAAGSDTSGAFCARPLGDDCSTSIAQVTATICTLDDGIAFACAPCRTQDAAACHLKAALVHGAQFTYIQIVNADVAWIYVYDQNQKLVAKLFWSANGNAWSCSAGPADFDGSEAMSSLPVSQASSELVCP